MLEREVKLAVTPGFRLPDRDDIAAAVATTPVDEQRLETVYYDTPDLRLARWGCTLRLRQGEGWTLKLPTTSEGPTLTRRELEFPGSGGRPPEAAVAMVIAYVRRSTLVPVASLLRHDPGVRLGDDPEDVHRARVATRRLRSQLRTFRGLLDQEWANALREDLRWLGAGLGGVRDRQVMSQRLRGRTTALIEDDGPLVAELADELRAESEEARGRLVLDMRSDRYIDLVERLVEASKTPALIGEAQQPAATGVPALARRDWKRLRKGVSRMPDAPADAQLHRVRILAKRVRYAAEAAVPVLGKTATRFAAAAAALQDVLGDHQDSVTAQRWLRDAGQGERAFVAGELCALEREAAAHDRAQWSKVWKNLDRKRLRRWMI